MKKSVHEKFTRVYFRSTHILNYQRVRVSGNIFDTLTSSLPHGNSDLEFDLWIVVSGKCFTVVWKFYRFQVAVYDVFGLQKSQAFQQRIRESPYQAQTESLVVVLLDQLIQIYAENNDDLTLLYFIKNRLLIMKFFPIFSGDFPIFLRKRNFANVKVF